MSVTFVKSQKTAAELAELIRTSVGKPDLRVAVFSAKGGWKAKVYPETGENVARLQARVDKKAAALSAQFDLIQ
jgi:hypothetical protein